MFDRISTGLIYRVFGGQIASNQLDLYSAAEKINTGKKFNTPYEDPLGITNSVQLSSKIEEATQRIKNINFSKANLEIAEASLVSMRDVVLRAKELATQAANGTLSAEDHEAIRVEVRALGESIIQMANTRVGEKFIFSGEQSDVKTVKLNPGDTFNNAVYKNNISTEKQTSLEGVDSSISIQDFLLNAGSPATMTSNSINNVIATAGSLDFVVNDGTGAADIAFTVAFAGGEDLATQITAINAAYTGAGGVGTIAQESPTGYLNIDSSLMTGSANNQTAKVQILTSSSSAVLSELSLKAQTVKGKDPGILNNLDSLEIALQANDSVTIGQLLDELEFNVTQVTSLQSKIGLNVAAFENLETTFNNLDLKLREDLSITEDIDLVEANTSLSDAQLRLQSAINSASNFYSQSLNTFL